MKAIVYFAILILYISCDFFLAGSYPYAEIYKFDLSQKELIEEINKLKKENPKYQLLDTLNSGEIIEYPKDRYSENFYNLNFHIPDLSARVHCAININFEEKPQKLLFNSIITTERFPKTKRINSKDLSRKENKKIKKIFEEQIVNKLGHKYERKKNIFGY